MKPEKSTSEHNLVLSVFPGIDLLGRGFTAAGFCVVRGPDLLWGESIEGFNPPAGLFVGIIGGSPCQDFSRLRRVPPRGDGVRALSHFARVVTQAQPVWALLENVPGVPDVTIAGYERQRFNVKASDYGCRQRRWRCFQFFHRDTSMLVMPRGVTGIAMEEPACLASEGNRAGRRAWPDFCELQGLPRDFELPGLSLAAKYRAVGNGVPIELARVLAIAIKRRRDTQGVAVCVCGCARAVAGRSRHAAAACRKRMERRRRDVAGGADSGPVTA